MRTKNLFNKLVSLMKYIDGQNNYEVTNVVVKIYLEGIEIHTYCRNEYGGEYGNRDMQFIYWEDVPNWVMRKLKSLPAADYYDIREDNEIRVIKYNL